MTHHFRRLTLDDKHDYLALMLAAYAPIKALGIQFDAATADLARVMRRALTAPEAAPTRFPVPGSETDMAQTYLRFFAARTGGGQGQKEQKT